MKTEFQYTEKEFSSVKDAALSKIPTLAPDWTNLNEGDLGMALLNLMAGMVDMLAFYTDRTAEQVFLPTAFTRDSVQRLTRLIDYRLSRPVSARAVLRFSLPSAATEDIVIPAYTRCATEGGLEFVTNKEATLFTGDTFVDVEVFQGKYVRETFTATGELTQLFTLARPKVSQNFLIVDVGSQRWQEDTIDVNYTEMGTYEVNTDSSDIATIRFSSHLGEVPSQNATITVSYLETVGGDGNIGAGKIIQLTSTVAGGEDLTVSNPEQARGGKDRESADEARVAAPRRLRTLNRATTLQDHVDLATNFDVVAKAQGINHYGYVEMYVAPDEGDRFFLRTPVPTYTTPVDASSTIASGNYDVVVTALDANGETADWEYVHNAQVSDDVNDDTRDRIARMETVYVASGDSLVASIPEVSGATSYRVYMAATGETPRLAGEAVAASGTTTITVLSVPVADAAEVPTLNTTGVRSVDGEESLKNALEKHLEERRLVGAIFALYNPTYIPVDVTASVVAYDNYKQADVEGRVKAALRDRFHFDTVEFAEDVAVGDLFKTMLEVEGVRTINDLTAPASNVVINDGEIAQLGTMTLTMSGGIV